MEQFTMDLTNIERAVTLKMSAEEIKATLKKKTKFGRCGCPFWGYNFDERHSECRLTCEARPDEGDDGFFRCDFDYSECRAYRQATGVIK